MTGSGRIKTFVTLAMLVLGNLSGNAAEVHLKPEYVCRRPVVRLDDIAELREIDRKQAEEIGETELFAAPSSQSFRKVKASELRELLTLHGIDMTSIQFRGAKEVVVRAAANPEPASVPAKPTRKIAMSTRPLSRGETIQKNDVVLKPMTSTANSSGDAAGWIDSEDKAVGLAVTRSLQAGEPVSAADLTRPIAIQRNEMISLVARSSGVQVRTSVKALEAGAVGDLITIETQDKDKSKLTARIIGPKSAEIFAGLPAVSASK